MSLGLRLMKVKEWTAYGLKAMHAFGLAANFINEHELD
jgi:hypothetical protein